MRQFLKNLKATVATGATGPTAEVDLSGIMTAEELAGVDALVVAGVETVAVDAVNQKLIIIENTAAWAGGETVNILLVNRAIPVAAVAP